jgi:hypothetical protein
VVPVISVVHNSPLLEAEAQGMGTNVGVGMGPPHKASISSPLVGEGRVRGVLRGLREPYYVSYGLAKNRTHPFWICLYLNILLTFHLCYT